MLKLKYLNEDITYDIEFQKISDSVVQITGIDFPVKETGFTLSRDNEDKTWDDWDYSGYTTVYRKIDGGAQFSNDETVYVDPENVDTDFPMIEISEAEKEKYEIQAQIASLKKELSDGDYKVIKNFEAESVGDIYPYDMYELHEEREALRRQINELEESLSLL